jgi:hypothetical protein
MHLVRPAAIAYFSGLNHHGVTEQLPRVVFVATDHAVRRRLIQSVGFTFRLVSMRTEKFFGVERAWVGGQSFLVTDREKTLIDALDLPQYETLVNRSKPCEPQGSCGSDPHPRHHRLPRVDHVLSGRAGPAPPGPEPRPASLLPSSRLSYHRVVG